MDHLIEQCEFPRCKHSPFLTLVERPICQMHWQQLCTTSTDAEENKLLKKIGLIRNSEGGIGIYEKS